MIVSEPLDISDLLMLHLRILVSIQPQSNYLVLLIALDRKVKGDALDADPSMRAIFDGIPNDTAADVTKVKAFLNDRFPDMAPAITAFTPSELMMEYAQKKEKTLEGYYRCDLMVLRGNHAKDRPAGGSTFDQSHNCILAVVLERFDEKLYDEKLRYEVINSSEWFACKSMTRGLDIIRQKVAFMKSKKSLE
jgi:hypothetical protein